MSFAGNMAKNISKNVNKNVSSKSNQKFFDDAKQSATDALKTSSERLIQKTAEATDDLIGNKAANNLTKISKTSQQKNSKTVANEHDKEILKEMYIRPEEKQKIFDDLRLV